jgi:two-component system response regulator HydG
MDEIERREYDLVVLCACRPGPDGLCLLSRARAIQSNALVVVIAGDPSVDTAVGAMQSGATDYVPRPYDVAEVLLRCERALRRREMHRELAHLRRTSRDVSIKVVAGTRAMEDVLDLLERAAPTRVTVLLTGETGTGKGILARYLHELSPRKKRNFVPVSCSALPEHLLESELFGHVKGSFTGAVAHQSGRFESAAGGTIFLDEVDTLTPPMQAKLLRVVEERTIQRVGADSDIPVDFRLVAAANIDMAQAVADGVFREDLWFRLNVFPIRLPPLRERRDDIPRLADHFRTQIAAELRMEPVDIPEAIMERMVQYDWPGNARELRNWVERALVLAARDGAVTLHPPQEPPNETAWSWSRPLSEGWSLERLQQEYIEAVLERADGHRSRAAGILGIDRRTLYRKVRNSNSSA